MCEVTDKNKRFALEELVYAFPLTAQEITISMEMSNPIQKVKPIAFHPDSSGFIGHKVITINTLMKSNFGLTLFRHTSIRRVKPSLYFSICGETDLRIIRRHKGAPSPTQGQMESSPIF